MSGRKVKVEDVAYHRNGICGEGFHVVTFRDGKDPMIAVVFETPGQVAVLNREQVGAGIITFGVASFRGDVYEADMRKAIEKYEEARNIEYMPAAEG